VYLRGGKKANSPYQIIKKGDKFLTVESMDPSNYDDDAIQVVMPMEILLPHEINHAAPTVNPFQTPMIRHDNYQEQPSFPSKEGIVFAPVIRIVNGNDNSTNDGQPASAETTHGGDPFSVPVINMSGGNATPAKIENTVTREATPVQAQESSSFGSGIIDFAKGFLIKKTG